MAEVLGVLHGGGPLPEGVDLGGAHGEDDVDVGVATPSGCLHRPADAVAYRGDPAGQLYDVGAVRA